MPIDLNVLKSIKFGSHRCRVSPCGVEGEKLVKYNTKQKNVPKMFTLKDALVTGGSAGTTVKMSLQIRPEGQSNLNTRQNTSRTFFVQTDIERSCKMLVLSLYYSPLYKMHFSIEEDHIKCSDIQLF